MIKKILLALLVVLVILQFFRPEKNIAAAASPNAIGTKYSVPADVQTILKKSCNDCHSNTTEYPWYASVQPVGLWLNHHIEEGKGELNFDEFTTYSPKKARHKLEEVHEAVTEGWMPLDSYLWIHHESKLTPEEAKVLGDWAKNLRESIPAPADEKEAEHPHEH